MFEGSPTEQDDETSGWLFIAGTGPRTGTTLMTWLLNLHPQVHIFCETYFPLAFLGLFRPDGQQSIGRQLPQIAAQAPGRFEEPEGTDDPGAVRCARACCEGLRSEWEPIRWFGDKAPNYVQSWQRLRALFPECRFLIMDRNAEEVLSSIRRCDWPWISSKSDDELRSMLAEWRSRAEEVSDAHWVKLEVLSDDPERELGTLMDWLSLNQGTYPWEAARLQVAASSPRVN